MTTEDCRNVNYLNFNSSISSDDSFHGFHEEIINYTTLPPEARTLTRKLEKLKEKINKVSLKINFNEVCLKNDLLPKFTNNTH